MGRGPVALAGFQVQGSPLAALISCLHKDATVLSLFYGATMWQYGGASAPRDRVRGSRGLAYASAWGIHMHDACDMICICIMGPGLQAQAHDQLYM